MAAAIWIDAAQVTVGKPRVFRYDPYGTVFGEFGGGRGEATHRDD